MPIRMLPVHSRRLRYPGRALKISVLSVRSRFSPPPFAPRSARSYGWQAILYESEERRVSPEASREGGQSGNSLVSSSCQLLVAPIAGSISTISQDTAEIRVFDERFGGELRGWERERFQEAILFDLEGGLTGSSLSLRISPFLKSGLRCRDR